MGLSVDPSKKGDWEVFLSKVPLFAQLNAAELATLAGAFRSRSYPKNQVIFSEGDDSDDLYVVLKGKVRIFMTSPGGNKTSINIFSTHNVIGEFATIDRQPRSATAEALGPCLLLEMAGSKFRQYLQDIPALSLAMTGVLATKLRWTAAYAEAIAQYDAAGRLLHILLRYNEQFGEVLEPGKSYRLDLGLNQEELASLVGARREWINRLLQDLRRRNLIEYQAGKIIIMDLPGVQEERDRRTEAYTSKL
jgi:CRP/FNR family transcriptional regulator, cyclic AMP receptor protein